MNQTTGGTQLQILQGHRDSITRLAWSPDGRRLASGSTDHTIRIWDTETGRCLRVLEGHQGWVWGVAWSPDGRQLASASQDWMVRIWDPETGVSVQTLRGPGGPVYSVSWSHDGRILASGAFDSLIRLWDTGRWELIREFSALYGGVNSVAWAPNRYDLASGSFDHEIRLWDGGTGRYVRSLYGHRGSVNSVAWAPDGKVLISGGADRSIRLWDPAVGAETWRIEGHTDSVARVCFSFDGRVIASRGMEGTVRCWHSRGWQEVFRVEEVGAGNRAVTWHAGIAFHPLAPILAALCQNDTCVRLWHLDFGMLEEIAGRIPPVHYTRAKVVLVGESNIGKTCLARQLTEGRYDSDTPTTHGLHFWFLPAGRLNPATLTPPGERREVILWDMGGQEVYSLVHQLLLDDTVLALVAFDPTRGATAYQEAEAWSRRLDQQLRGKRLTKLLVGTRLDDETAVIDEERCRQLVERCGFSGFYHTSAKTPRGIPALREAMSDALNWESLVKNSRPDLFRRIRDKIQSLTAEGAVVVELDALTEEMRRQSTDKFASVEVDTVVRQLSMQGAIVDTRLTSGKRALVLQIGEVVRYACSVILAARDNPRGVPAIEERIVAMPWMKFPGIQPEQRLERKQECPVLEAVLQLLVEHGICVRHERVLVFPSLFRPGSAGGTTIPDSVVLFYELSGAIDNVYASLVSRLAVSKRFGRMRLWEDRAEFEKAGRGACGLRRVVRTSGYGHLGIFFENETPEDTRDLFIEFVKRHLIQSSVSILEHPQVTCACGYAFPETVILDRLTENEADIGCPRCDQRTQIAEAGRSGTRLDPQLGQRIQVLEVHVQEQTQFLADLAKDHFKDQGSRRPKQPIRILHLSDLHMDDVSDPQAMLHPLLVDLTDPDEGLGVDSLNFIVVSGDLTRKATPTEFEKARQFISGLIESFRSFLSSERCIVVPGNHDVDWNVAAYSWRGRRPRDTEGLAQGSFIEDQKVLGLRDETAYPKRLLGFSENFYHPLIQQPYPLPFEEQCIPFFFAYMGIQFLAINSCWQTDEFFPDRAGIHLGALARGLQRADDQIKRAGKSDAMERVLRIAVWHHPLGETHQPEAAALFSQLESARVRLCLHGHLHQETAMLANFPNPRRLWVAGVGSFGAVDRALPHAVPRQYNLIEVWRDHSKVRIRTRAQQYAGGAFSPHTRWPGASPDQRRDSYEINLTKTA